MIFHVVAIRELFGKNYSIDLLFFGITEEKIREIMHEYKLVILELSEFKKDQVELYGKIKILIEVQGQDYRLLSNSLDINGYVYLLTIIGFNVKNINHVNTDIISQTDIDQIIKSEKEKANIWIKEQNDIILKSKEQENVMFDDQKLEKTLVLVKEFLEKIPAFIEKTKGVLSRSELKELFNESQELSKLRMGSNVEKISSYFEQVYNHYNSLEQEYLSIQTSLHIDVPGSNISDSYLMSEITKLEKAKSLFKLGGARSGEDALYANFGGLLLYFKLLKKEFGEKLRNMSWNGEKIFYYIELLFLFILLFDAIYMCMSKENGSIPVIMVYAGVFGLLFFGISFIKCKDLLHNISLLVLGIFGSLILIRMMKQFFIF